MKQYLTVVQQVPRQATGMLGRRSSQFLAMLQEVRRRNPMITKRQQLLKGTLSIYADSLDYIDSQLALF